MPDDLPPLPTPEVRKARLHFNDALHAVYQAQAGWSAAAVVAHIDCALALLVAAKAAALGVDSKPAAGQGE